MENKFTSDFLSTNSGDKEISYANNSLLQKTIILKLLPTLNDALRETFSKRLPTSTFEVADLGCSSGPNIFLIISQVIDSIHGVCQQAQLKVPQIRVFLNDLPGNDFNAIFQSLPGFFERLKQAQGKMVEPCFIVGVPGSFYGRLFPTRTLHFVHSFNCLHWLSKVPPELKDTNKGNICITKSSPANVIKAYAKQFETDFSAFLSSRSQELMPGGQMLLLFQGRHSQNPWSEDCFFALLGQSLVDLVSEGLTTEADVDSFNLPLYKPCKGELYEIIESEGSFGVEKMEISEVDWVPRDQDDVEFLSGQYFSNIVRAVSEQMISHQFGDATTNRLFMMYAANIEEHLRDRNKGKLVNFLVSLTKK
ncbi:hypothetical protein like AT5G38020 [Hibiscus trionum]|uniref:Uncharacterized protein n=1 Tax=Hibiscus trionum TaxID=183268 RepID=A0A9W7HQS4_HIBTR|nr:hypothetical protein like AT5G38020 [Hibiscus trionum]